MNEVLHTIHLHGHLAKFGRRFKFAVNSPLEAARFLMAQIPGFAEALREGHYRLVRGHKKHGLQYGEEELDFSLGQTPTSFHFIPVLAGRKSGGVGKIVAGVFIMAAAVVAAPFTGGTSLMGGLSAFSFGFGGATAFSIGAAIALSGVASLFTPSMKSPVAAERPADRPSFFLGGPVNMAEQGGAVPVLYGRFMCGSHIIGASIEVVDV